MIKIILVGFLTVFSIHLPQSAAAFTSCKEAAGEYLPGGDWGLTNRDAFVAEYCRADDISTREDLLKRLHSELEDIEHRSQALTGILLRYRITMQAATVDMQQAALFLSECSARDFIVFTDCWLRSIQMQYAVLEYKKAIDALIFEAENLDNRYLYIKDIQTELQDTRTILRYVLESVVR